MQLARLQRPRASQGFYGGPGLPAPGAMMQPPAPAYPRMSAASTAPAMPFAPTPAAPVTTNNPAPFQLSVNNHRATEARSAATFAAHAPLPMAPVPTPALQPPTPAPAPAMPSPGMAQPATSPIGQEAIAAAPAAPQMQYSGAFRNEQEAQAARDAYVQRQNDTANAQDRGPGLGINSYANAELQQDANARANEAASTPNAKDEYYQAGAAERQARADTLIPAQAKAADAKGAATTALTQPKVDNLKAGTDATRAKGEAATANAATNAKNAMTRQQAAQDKMLVEKLKTTEQKLRSDNRLDATAKRAMLHEKISDLNKRRMIAINAGIRTDDKGGINDQIIDAMKEMQPAQAPATPPPAGQVAPATQPTSSAQPLVGHDPAKRTPEAIAETARNRGISEDEVLKRLGVTA